MDAVQEFYDGLADSYEFLFADWQRSVHRQAEAISAFLTGLGYAAPCRVLDCTCGIGTQAIGLALKGYRVHGTDLSEKAVEQARTYARQFMLPHAVRFDVADLLQPPASDEQYDVVLAYDNPFAHMLTGQDLVTAFRTMAAQARPGGLLTTSLRDYDALAQERPRHSLVSVRDMADGRRIVFQVWDWDEAGQGYDSEMFVITPQGDGWQTRSYQTRFRAWRRDEMTQCLTEAGLSDITWHKPEQSGFYQPIVTARKPS